MTRWIINDDGRSDRLTRMILAWRGDAGSLASRPSGQLFADPGT
jgi:hypothetical protein